MLPPPAGRSLSPHRAWARNRYLATRVPAGAGRLPRCTRTPLSLRVRRSRLTGRFRFAEVTVPLTSGVDLREQIVQALPSDNALVRLIVSGMLSDDECVQWNQLRARLESDLPILRVDDDDVHPSLSLADVDRRFAHGSFVHELLSALVRAGDHEATIEALDLIERART